MALGHQCPRGSLQQMLVSCTARPFRHCVHVTAPVLEMIKGRAMVVLDNSVARIWTNSNGRLDIGEDDMDLVNVNKGKKGSSSGCAHQTHHSSQQQTQCYIAGTEDPHIFYPSCVGI